MPRDTAGLTTPIPTIADKVAERLLSALRRQAIVRIDIDIVRAACEIAAHYEAMDAAEFRELEDLTLRKLIGKVG